MTWFFERVQIWRAAVLALFIVVMVGPWTFDQINVPAEYSCSSPFVRLEGDYCGLPMSGIWLAGWMGLGALAETARLFTGSVPLENWWRGPAIGLTLIVILLPFITTITLALHRESRRWRGINLAAWALAGAILLLIVLDGKGQDHPALWGLRGYCGLAIAALILELSAAGHGRSMQ